MTDGRRIIDIHHGDCIEMMRAVPPESVDAIVTDPPYGLGFMGKHWDDLPPGKEWADECLRVLKPGGHLLAFGGTRTWHRIAVAVEDAGFEIRDSIAWLYGSGFPKSLDVSKAIDKRKDWTLVEGLADEIARARKESGMSLTQVGERMLAETNGQYGKWYHRGGFKFHETGRTLPSVEEWGHLQKILPIAEKFIPVYSEAKRAVVGRSSHKSGIGNASKGHYTVGGTVAEYVVLTAPETEAAKHWAGWGTALKPAFEPVVVARKPLLGTVAGNVQAWGTGAINIEACRHGDRWPTNVILDESQEQRLSEARFFYTAKAPKSERPIVDGVAHPTVKPLALMRWLIRLVTPPGGTVLDPFAGSGTTIEAAILEGFHVIGIEREAEYLPLIQARIDRQAATLSEPVQDTLEFGDVA